MNDDKEIPVMSRMRLQKLDAYTALKFAPSHLICSKIPPLVAESASFLIDLEAIADPEDWISNQVGGFKQNGRSYSRVEADGKGGAIKYDRG